MSNGLTDTLRVFYETYSRELFAYALSIAGNDVCAEDAVHDAFCAVLGKGTLPRELRPYLFRCVRNAAIDARRVAARESQKCSIFSEGLEAHVREQAEAFLECMSGDERECVVLKLYGGLTFREIAAVLDVPAGTVAARYWRALAKVREKLRSEA
jgi:RNA polymerase sigma-70 factor (ECF subfamily)